MIIEACIGSFTVIVLGSLIFAKDFIKNLKENISQEVIEQVSPEKKIILSKQEQFKELSEFVFCSCQQPCPYCGFAGKLRQPTACIKSDCGNTLPHLHTGCDFCKLSWKMKIRGYKY
jgi:hypothetical protein